MKKIILWITNVSALVLGLFFGMVWLSRIGLNYNSEGKYFDEVTLVTYDTDALLAYSIISLFFVFLAILSWTFTIRIRKKI